MDTLPPQQKKGLGPLAWIGIGCGGIIVLGIVAIVAFSLIFGKDIKNFAEKAQQNPTRFTADMVVKASAGQIEYVAEDDANKRYTIKEKANGKLTTIYWNAKTQAPETIQGDFSAIPADTQSAAPDAAPAPAPAPTPQQ